VRTFYDKCKERQAARLSELKRNGENYLNITQLTRDDILGPKATLENLMNCAAFEKFMKMEGLKEVKRSVQELMNLVIKNSELEEDEQPLVEVALNRVFLGKLFYM
jgi:hypothetical protein